MDLVISKLPMYQVVDGLLKTPWKSHQSKILNEHKSTEYNGGVNSALFSKTLKMKGLM